MEIKIEKGIPIPTIRQRNQTGLAAALRQLEIGDSFTYGNVRQSGNISNAAKQQGIRVITRREGETVRVWRVE